MGDLDLAEDENCEAEPPIQHLWAFCECPDDGFILLEVEVYIHEILNSKEIFFKSRGLLMTSQKSIKGLLIYLLIGIITMFFMYLQTLSILSTNPTELEQMGDMMGISGPPEMLASLSQIPNFILLIIALVIGFFTAHKVGLKSAIIHPIAREKSKSEWIKGTKLAIILGSIVGVVLKGVNYLTQPYLPDSLIETLQLYSPYSALHFINALLYGGILEELLARFGVMSLLVFIFWKLFNRKSAKPSNWVFILAIFVSTLFFALGHYGPTARATEMTALIWLQMILLNGLPGLVYGWIYWKHNLELAMLAHMFTHIGMNLLLLIVSFFSAIGVIAA